MNENQSPLHQEASSSDKGVLLQKLEMADLEKELDAVTITQKREQPIQALPPIKYVTIQEPWKTAEMVALERKMQALAKRYY